jgi:hypothetical protein
MPQFIRLRPEYKCHESEQKVAALLRTLPEHWIVVWGYYYKGPKGVVREGDFLIFDPDKGVLVVEAKGGILKRNQKTGQWNTPSRTAPDAQLFREIMGVRDILGRAGGGRKLVVKGVLACPDLFIRGKGQDYEGLSRDLIMDRGDLESFKQKMHDVLGGFCKVGPQEAEKIFRKAFVKEEEGGVDAKSFRETDKYLNKLIKSKAIRMIKHLIHNKQFVVRGAPGSGKSWMAMHLASIWAGRSRERGDSVLIICYHHALKKKLNVIAQRMEDEGRTGKGKITVKLWEDLARETLEANGIAFEVPEDKSKFGDFYDVYVPTQLERLVQEGAIVSKYDCLIVDEAQDHDTEFPENTKNGPGWWSFYFSLMKEGKQARTALLYDTDQRPSFRRDGVFGFDVEKVYKTLEANPLRLNLFESYRYTMNIFNYLKKLKKQCAKIQALTLTAGPDLPQGEPVTEVSMPDKQVSQYLKKTIGDLLQRKVCKPEEIMILAHSFNRDRHLVGKGDEVAGVKLHTGLFPTKNKILFMSSNRAKGLETKVAFLIGYPPGSDKESDIQNLFIGASRARQILYVITKAK